MSWLNSLEQSGHLGFTNTKPRRDLPLALRPFERNDLRDHLFGTLGHRTQNALGVPTLRAMLLVLVVVSIRGSKSVTAVFALLWYIVSSPSKLFVPTVIPFSPSFYGFNCPATMPALFSMAKQAGAIARAVSAYVLTRCVTVIRVPFGAVRLTGPVATSHVFRMCYRLQVSGIHARFISAQMIKFFVFGNWPNGLLVSESVRDRKTSRTIGSATHPKVTVASCVRSPDPAWTKLRSVLRDWTVFVYLGPKTSGDRGVNNPSRFKATSTRPALVVPTAPASSATFSVTGFYRAFPEHWCISIAREDI